MKLKAPRTAPERLLRTLRSEDAPICAACAAHNGATQPEGTPSQWSGICSVCREFRALYAMSDWDWPAGAEAPFQPPKEH